MEKVAAWLNRQDTRGGACPTPRHVLEGGADMIQPETNIDSIVDYRAEYSAAIKKHKITGDQLVGVCPFHDDKKESFSANLKNGQWYCFAEGRGGNFVSFWAELCGVSTNDAYKQILDKYGARRDPDPEPGRTKQQKQQKENTGELPYTLQEYAFSKRLPEDFLTGICGVSTGKDRSKTAFLKIPYYNEEGTGWIYRKRYANKEFRWSYGSAGKLILYGDWRLPEIRKSGKAILVEGESDTQTLWFMQLPALGVPGAANFKEKFVHKLQDLKLYIHVEPDKGGETFLQKVTKALKEGEFIGEVYKWSCQGFGVKDPSDLFIKHGAEEAARLITGALRAAERVDLDDLAGTIPEAVAGAPVNLRQPEGFIYSEGGIRKIDERTKLPVRICRTPIIITRRLRSMETGEEKVEVAFKRDNTWHTAIYPRSTVFTARGITVLADLGCTITSENAKQVVQFLEALEAENIDVITRADSTGTMGWQTRGRFLPGHGGDIILDIEPSLRSWAAAYHPAGTFRDWIRIMAPHRQRDKFRFILAAAFTAPLLKILRQRIFFVYNWGGSKGGKTAALKAALSVWGDPEHLMVNFNATQVALERMAGFYNDLPMGIDERQLAGNKQETLERIIYMIASGTGRARGSKSGGLQTLNTWRTVALATGEEPLSTETTQTGISTRVLEIYGGPFDDERSASRMHQQAPEHCGWAGPEFIARILKTDTDSIRDKFAEMQEAVNVIAGGTSGSHVAGISAVALADAMIETWFFAPKKQKSDQNAREIDQDPEEMPESGAKMPVCIHPDAWRRALQMAESIIREQLAAGIGDVNEHATQFCVDWILSNKSQFGTRAIGTCLGFISDANDHAYIFPSRLQEALTKAGYSSRKTLRYLADNGIITSTPKADGGKIYSVTKWFDGRTVRVIEFDLGRFSKKVDPLDEDQISETEKPEPEPDQDGFLKLPEGESAPFEDDYGQFSLPFTAFS